MDKTQYLVMVAYGFDEVPYNNLICEGIFDDKQEALDYQADLLKKDTNGDIEHVFVYQANKL